MTRLLFMLNVINVVTKHQSIFISMAWQRHTSVDPNVGDDIFRSVHLLRQQAVDDQQDRGSSCASDHESEQLIGTPTTVPAGWESEHNTEQPHTYTHTEIWLLLKCSHLESINTFKNRDCNILNS